MPGTSDFSSDDEEEGYTAWFQDQKGQIFFDFRYFHYEPTTENSTVAGKRIKWKDLVAACELNSGDSPRPKLKLVFHDESRKALTFHLKSRAEVEAICDIVNSKMTVKDEEN